MILRFAPLLWKQLDGPQANAIVTGLFLYFQNLVSSCLAYFDGLNISTANSAHLDLFGSVAGVPRPLVWTTDDPYWTRWFRVTEESTETDQGFSDPDNPLLVGIGGLLSYEYQEYFDPERQALDATNYRAILEEFTRDESGPGSLILLDRLIALFYDPADYTIEQPVELSPGDILVNLAVSDVRSYTALYSITRLWLPNTHVTLNVEV